MLLSTTAATERRAGRRTAAMGAGGAHRYGGGDAGGDGGIAPATGIESVGASPRNEYSEAHRRSSHKQAFRQCGFDRKLALIGLLLHGATQVVSLLSWSGLPGSERFQRLLSIAQACAFWLLPTLAPQFYLRRRHAIIVLHRLAFFAYPLLRKPRGARAPPLSRASHTHAAASFQTCCAEHHEDASGWVAAPDWDAGWLGCA